MYINPDLIERVEGQHQTVIHMSNGVEYVVAESPQDIIDQILALHVRVITAAAAGLSGSPDVVAAAMVAYSVAGGVPEVSVVEADD
jgi:uncharacterized protein YlzI (FlbEa/FlbD family)